MSDEPTWKKQGFRNFYEYNKSLLRKKGFLTHKEREYITVRPSLPPSNRNPSKKHLCESLQKIIHNVKDPESLFNNIELVREITGCRIPTKK